MQEQGVNLMRKLHTEEIVGPYQDALNLLKAHQIPESYPEADNYPYLYGEGSLDEGSYSVRDEVIRLAGYCFLSYNWIRPLAKWVGERRCLEIMCGSGALSKGLQNCGVKILATDNYRWEENRFCWYENAWTQIEQLDGVSAIRKYGKSVDLVVCSWPYVDDDCYKSLLTMRKVNPRAMMIYIGEERGRNTANDNFFDAIRIVDDSGFQEAIKAFRSSYQLHDKPMLVQ